MLPYVILLLVFGVCVAVFTTLVQRKSIPFKIFRAIIYSLLVIVLGLEVWLVIVIV